MNTGKYSSISKIFNTQELIYLEEALEKYNPDYLSEEGSKKLAELKENITAARRWSHQFGKTQR